MGYMNDNAAYISGGGGLTLGRSGVSESANATRFTDGADDPTYPYAKQDVYLPVPANMIMVAAGATGTWSAPTSIARSASNGAGLPPAITLATAATAYFLHIPIHDVLRTYTTVGHGFLVKGVRWAYTVTNTVLTANPTVVFGYEAVTNGSARANTAFAGTVTYQNPPGTTANPPTATSATPVVAVAMAGTPIWVTGYEQIPFAEIQMNTGATNGTALVWTVQLIGSAGLY